MARHSLFPNSVTINYTSNGHQHKQVLPTGVVAGTAPGWTLPTKGGTPVDWRTAVADYAAIMADLLDTSSSVDSAELYTYEATNSPAELLAVEPLDVAGTGLFSAVPFAQAVFPFKALGGTSVRPTLLESIIAVNQKYPFAAATDPPIVAYMEFFLSDDDWVITRGGDFPTISLGLTSKTNDKLRERYLLDT